MPFSDSISPGVPQPPESPPLSSPLPEDPPWNLWDVALIAIFAFVTLLIGLRVAVEVAHSLPHFHQVKRIDLAQNAVVLAPAQTLAYLVVVTFMVQLVRMRRRTPFRTAISWSEPPLKRTLLALGGGTGLALLSSVFTGLFSHWMPKSFPVDKLFRDAGSAYVLSIFGIIVAPFVEELFFRGFLYPALARRIGVVPSVVLTAAGFAVVHQEQLAQAWVPLAWLFIVGMVLTVVRARTKSVATCVLIHMAYNVTLFALLFIATQGFRHMERG